jgi:hypothetical protein
MTPRQKLRKIINGGRYVMVPGAYDPKRCISPAEAIRGRTACRTWAFSR